MDPWRSASSIVWFNASSNCSGSAVRKSPPTMLGSRSLCNPSGGAFSSLSVPFRSSSEIPELRTDRHLAGGPEHDRDWGQNRPVAGSSGGARNGDTQMSEPPIRSVRPCSSSEPLSLNMPASRITAIGASQDLREMSVRQVARRTVITGRPRRRSPSRRRQVGPPARTSPQLPSQNPRCAGRYLRRSSSEAARPRRA